MRPPRPRRSILAPWMMLDSLESRTLLSSVDLRWQLTGPSGTLIEGAPLHFTARVYDSQNTPLDGNTLTLCRGSDSLATATLAAGMASFDITAAVGTTPYYFTFSPLAGSTDTFTHTASALLPLRVLPPTATTAGLTLSAAPQAGKTLTLTAVVTPQSTGYGTLAGTVQFYSNGELLGTRPVSGRKATLTAAFPAAGDIALTATFVPSNDRYLTSTSAEFDVHVTQANVIDVLALMSRQAMASFDENLARFQQEIDLANQAFLFSQIPLELRLTVVGGSSYDESGDLRTDLNHLRNLSDGYLDEAGPLRNGYCADLVVLIDSAGTTEGNFVTQGIATQLMSASDPYRSQAAYLVIDISASLDDYVLAHEVGHTLGVTHALGDPSDHGSTAYAHGYRFTGTDNVLYRDIMAYEPGTVVGGFSNPAVSWEGVPMGNARTADAARVIRATAPIVAAYRTPTLRASVDTLTVNQISGYALDPRVQDPLTVRVDIDNVTRATFQADDTYHTIEHGYSYTFPPLSQGHHTLKLYGFDRFTNAWVLLVTRSISTPSPFFDEAYYLAHNADVAAAVTAGTYKSGWDQFQRVGQYQGRDPSDYFDTQYFLDNNPTVTAAVQSGAIRSPFQYFVSTGQKLGMNASDTFNEQYYLASYLDVAALVARRKYRSGLEHYLLVGRDQGLLPLPPVAQA